MLVLCLLSSLLMGCSSILPAPDGTQPENTEPEQSEAANVDEILRSALDGFFPVLSQSGEYEKLQDYLKDQYYAVPTAYAYVDFDGNGQNEMVIQTDSRDASAVVLYYGGEDVFFFLFSQQQMKQIKADGSFAGGDGSQITYATLEFPGGGYRLLKLAEADYDGGTYSVGGTACNEKSFVEFEKEWAVKSNVSWTELSIQPVEKPEEQTEPETEPETQPEQEDDGSYRLNIPRQDQPIYAGPGYHYSYVGNIGIAGIYTIVEESKDQDGNLWGKLKSGIGWVDLNDVHRSDKPITIDYADPDLLESGNFHHCDKNAGAHSIAVAFRAHETLYNIQIFYNTYDYEYEIENGYDLFYLKKLTPDKPIVAAISFTDTSVYLISFEDAYGNFYLYEFYESGADTGGWAEIVEVER